MKKRILIIGLASLLLSSNLFAGIIFKGTSSVSFLSEDTIEITCSASEKVCAEITKDSKGGGDIY